MWFGRLLARAERRDLSGIHGSYDHIYENVIGKCFILGLNANIPRFHEAMGFVLDFLEVQIAKTHSPKLTFDKMYQYRDNETLLVCYLPFLGYANEPAVRCVAEKRINLVYEFTQLGRYDIYPSDRRFPGAHKAWKPYIVDPQLYADGNIRLPSIHDLILYAGIYPDLDEEMRRKVEVTVGWIFGEGYSQINNTLYYYAADDPSYRSKAINDKVILPSVEAIRKGEHQARDLLYLSFILSHFRAARQSTWFAALRALLATYRTSEGRYLFPREMIREKKDSYVIYGGHMNVGEPRRPRLHAELLSTYWAERILANDAGTDF